MYIPFFSKKEIPPPPPPVNPWKKIFKRVSIGFGIFFGIVIILLFFASYPFYTDGFFTLQNVITYSKEHKEDVPIETPNTIKPVFDTYYSQFIPTSKTKIIWKTHWLLGKLHLDTTPNFSPSFFKTQLDTLCKTRESKGQKGNFVVKITTMPQSKFVVFGNLQGAFHPLSRSLEKLKELGIIDDSLTITNPDYWILFMGDVVSRSPYSMETLSLVMKLMQKNPDNIIYLKGNHESSNYWQEHTLKTELQIRAAHLSKEQIPLADLVNQFFNTLPIAAYITIDDTHLIRLSEAARAQNPLLTEDLYAGFLSEKSGQKLSILNLDEKKSVPGAPVTISVIIKNEKKRETYQTMEGLRLLAPDMGSVAWNILSCPTPVYQQAIKFVYDSFAVITPGANLDSWKITHYNRDVRTKDPFKSTEYCLLSGQKDGITTNPAPQQAQPPVQTPQVQPQIQAPTPTTPSAIAQPAPQQVVAPAPITPPVITPAPQKSLFAPAMQEPKPAQPDVAPSKAWAPPPEPEKKDQQISVDQNATDLEKQTTELEQHVKEIKNIVEKIKQKK